jgi:hypothetical protein
MNSPRIMSVQPLPERQLLVTFVNGVQKLYDCRLLLDLDRFQLLKYDAFFKAVTVDPGGYGISWNDAMDVSEYELWQRGVALEASSAAGEERLAGQPKEDSA